LLIPPLADIDVIMQEGKNKFFAFCKRNGILCPVLHGTRNIKSLSYSRSFAGNSSLNLFVLSTIGLTRLLPVWNEVLLRNEVNLIADQGGRI